MNRREMIKTGAVAASSMALVGGISLGNGIVSGSTNTAPARRTQIYFGSKISIESHSILNICANVIKYNLSEGEEEKEWNDYLPETINLSKLDIVFFRILKTKCSIIALNSKAAQLQNFAYDHYSNPGEYKTQIKIDYVDETTCDVLDCLWEAVHFRNNYCLISFDILEKGKNVKKHVTIGS